MGNSEVFKILIYGLRVFSIICIVLGVNIFFFEFLNLSFSSGISLINIGIFLLFFSYYISV